MLLEVVTVSDSTTTTVNRSIMGRARIGVDANVVKDEYMRINKKRTRIRPLQHYSDGINAIDPFDQFRNFYLVLENYLKGSKDITTWIRKKLPKIEMKTDIFGNNITIFSWIRHKLSHAKKNNKGLTPLSISKPEDVL